MTAVFARDDKLKFVLHVGSARAHKLKFVLHKGFARGESAGSAKSARLALTVLVSNSLLEMCKILAFLSKNLV